MDALDARPPSTPARRAAPHLRTWRRFAPLGLTTVGLGLSLVGEAAARKERGDGWVLYGTAALCVVNAGLCVFGEAVKHRALADWTLSETERSSRTPPTDAARP